MMSNLGSIVIRVLKLLNFLSCFNLEFYMKIKELLYPSTTFILRMEVSFIYIKNLKFDKNISAASLAALFFSTFLLDFRNLAYL